MLDFGGTQVVETFLGLPTLQILRDRRSPEEPLLLPVWKDQMVEVAVVAVVVHLPWLPSSRILVAATQTLPPTQVPLSGPALSSTAAYVQSLQPSLNRPRLHQAQARFLAMPDGHWESEQIFAVIPSVPEKVGLPSKNMLQVPWWYHGLST